MCFFYTEYICVTIDTQITVDSILEIILFYIILMRSLFMCYTEKQKCTLYFYIKYY